MARALRGRRRALGRALSGFASKDPVADPIAWFQQTRGLDVDGIAGPQTRGALVREYMADAALPDGTDVEAVARVSDDDHLELFFFDDGGGAQPPSSDPAAHDGWQERVRRTMTKSVAYADAGQLVPILRAEDIHFGVERVVFLPEHPHDDDGEQQGVTGLSFARAVLQRAWLEPETTPTCR